VAFIAWVHLHPGCCKAASTPILPAREAGSLRAGGNLVEGAALGQAHAEGNLCNSLCRLENQNKGTGSSIRGRGAGNKQCTGLDGSGGPGTVDSEAATSWANDAEA